MLPTAKICVLRKNEKGNKLQKDKHIHTLDNYICSNLKMSLEPFLMPFKKNYPQKTDNGVAGF